MNNLLQKFEKEQIKKLTSKKSIPTFRPGDTLKVILKITEGERSRLQAFEGVCTARKNNLLNSKFTVRKLSHGEGVERVFPLFSPNIDKIEVILGPATALFYAVKETWFVTKASLDFIISMFKGKGDTTQLGGPIKIAKITGQVAQHGFIAFLSVMAYISISLGFINLFPIPMLDGGHLMFYAFEKILGRPLTQRTQEGFFRIGLFLLISLMFFTTFNDLKDLGLF